MLIIAEEIPTVPNLPQTETARSPPTTPFAKVQSAQVEDEAHGAAARTMIALSQEIQTVPNLPPSETARSLPTTVSASFQSAQDEDEAHDAAWILRTMSHGHVHAPRPRPKKTINRHYPSFRARLQRRRNVVSPQQAPRHPLNGAIMPRPPPYQLSRNIMRRAPSATVTNPPQGASSSERPREL